VRDRHPFHVSVIAVVALGGAIGAVLRYALTVTLPEPGLGFPWVIFAVNVVGCFTLAVLPAVAVVRSHALLPPLLGPGLLGGFTTMSTYVEQARELVASGRTLLAATYVVGTFAACWLAVVAASRLTTAGDRVLFEDEEGDL
jgi:CrcB protein